MAKTDFRSVDEYIATHPTAVQKVLTLVRDTIRKALPEAVETISYQIPTYKQHGGAVVYFAGWKKHFSIYPAGAELLAAFGDELARYQISKGTIRFPLDEPVPTTLIERIARHREKETLARTKGKGTAATTGSRKASAAKKPKVARKPKPAKKAASRKTATPSMTKRKAT